MGPIGLIWAINGPYCGLKWPKMAQKGLIRSIKCLFFTFVRCYRSLFTHLLTHSLHTLRGVLHKLCSFIHTSHVVDVYTQSFILCVYSHFLCTSHVVDYTSFILISSHFTTLYTWCTVLHTPHCTSYITSLAGHVTVVGGSLFFTFFFTVATGQLYWPPIVALVIAHLCAFCG